MNILIAIVAVLAVGLLLLTLNQFKRQNSVVLRLMQNNGIATHNNKEDVKYFKQVYASSHQVAFREATANPELWQTSGSRNHYAHLVAGRELEAHIQYLKSCNQ